jgi:hypothetical protein
MIYSGSVLAGGPCFELGKGITFALIGAADRVCLLTRCRRDISGLDTNAMPSPAM